MKKSRPNRILVPFLLLIAAIVVAVNGWLALTAVNTLIHSQSWVDHSWQTINQIERIMGSARDAETGNRGFLLTGEAQYLEPYTAARRDLPGELDHLHNLIQNEPAEQGNFEVLQSTVIRRLDLLEQGIELRRRISTADRVSNALQLTGSGKEQMDNLRVIADRMETVEHRLLADRMTVAKSSATRARYTMAFASTLDFILILLMFRYFVRERRMRIASELDAERLAVARAETEEQAEQVRSLNATLEDRVRQRTAELETVNHELEAFSYSVSHDLRAPLRTIDGFSLALEEDYTSIVDDTGRDYIRRVRGGVQRMGQLIDALLQLSRITRAEIDKQEIDITQMAESIATDLKDQNRGRDITFNIEGGLTAVADPGLLHVALENLFNNAVKFTSKLPAAIIDFGWDPQQNAWFIRDNGAGFDMYYADRLFSAFNRLHGDKDFKGSGIGLATVARVIHRHHGRIWAESALNHGATFWFTL
ncbi:MAG TPA: CHASE3 domain-containing protein [Edaphobacter sp.]|nr:CHASE3 domain-containing protein [Edaphobacter sp.]